MRVRRVEAKREDLLEPNGPGWRTVRATTVVLSPTPLEMQPSEYVRVSWKGRPYGHAASVKVSAAHNGSDIFFRLSWADPSADKAIADINQFVDAAALLFPLSADAPLFGMGAPGKPVNAWLWRPDWERPKNVAAEGMGSTERRDDAALAGRARHARGTWTVVFSRPLNGKGGPAGTVALEPGSASKIAVAIWQGSNQERAGVKAFSPDWQPLEIEA